MRRATLPLVVAVTALLPACLPAAPAEDAGPPVSDLAHAPLMAPPPIDRSPLPCAASEASATELPFGEVPRDVRHLRPEVVPHPRGATCTAPRELLYGPGLEAPLAGTTLRAGAGVRFEPHFAQSAVPLGLGPWALVAEPSGLWLYDLGPMSRRARLFDGSVAEVAAAEDGRSFAFIAAASSSDDAPEAGTLVFARFPELTITHRFERAPRGRLRMAPDGRRAVIAAGAEGLVLFDAESGKRWGQRVEGESVADARIHPRAPDRVLYVGDGNRVGLRDMVTGEELAQREGGGVPLFTRRDLRALAYEASEDLTIAGGDDDLAHLFQGLFGEHPRELARVRMGGDVVDIGCCREGRFLAAAETGEVKWVDPDGEVLWELPALLPAALGEEVHVAPVSGTDVLLTVAGRAVLWQPRRPLLAPQDFGMLIHGQDVGPKDTLVFARSGGRVVVHRVSGPPALLARTEVLGHPDWYDVPRVLRTEAGNRALVGLGTRGTSVAFVPVGGALAVGDARHPPLGRHVEIEPVRGEPAWIARDGEGRAVRILPDDGAIEAVEAR